MEPLIRNMTLFGGFLKKLDRQQILTKYCNQMNTLDKLSLLIRLYNPKINKVAYNTVEHFQPSLTLQNLNLKHISNLQEILRPFATHLETSNRPY